MAAAFHGPRCSPRTLRFMDSDSSETSAFSVPFAVNVCMCTFAIASWRSEDSQPIPDDAFVERSSLRASSSPTNVSENGAFPMRNESLSISLIVHSNAARLTAQRTASSRRVAPRARINELIIRSFSRSEARRPRRFVAAWTKGSRRNEGVVRNKSSLAVVVSSCRVASWRLPVVPS